MSTKIKECWTEGTSTINKMFLSSFFSGALGPVDGINPELSNLTCSLTFVNPGDIVFLTSDGVSDNFDPVVGKFCVPAKLDAQSKYTKFYLRAQSHSRWRS